MTQMEGAQAQIQPEQASGWAVVKRIAAPVLALTLTLGACADKGDGRDMQGLGYLRDGKEAVDLSGAVPVAYVNPGFDFEDGTSCGPNANRNEGKTSYEEHKDKDLQSYFADSRKALFEQRPGLATARVDWINKNAPWQFEMLGLSDGATNVSHMTKWVEAMEVQESAEVVDTDNFGCKLVVDKDGQADDQWEVFDIPADPADKFEAPWGAGSPWIVVKNSEVRADGVAVITRPDGSKLEVKAGDFIAVKTKGGAVKVGVSLFTCDNPQLPLQPEEVTTPTQRKIIRITTTTTTAAKLREKDPSRDYNVRPGVNSPNQGPGSGGTPGPEATTSTTTSTTRPNTSSTTTTVAGNGTTTTTPPTTQPPAPTG